MTAKGRILVVDDDRLVLATVTHGLVQAGYEVIDADNGDDAILLARQHRPELALLDIRMEGKTGFDVAEYLRDVAQVPFMFLSAFTDAETRAKVAALGALAYLVKPLDVGQIVPTVEQVFARVRSGELPPRPPAAAPAVQAVQAVQASPPASATPAPAALPAVATATSFLPAAPALAVAQGILMHRYSLTLAQAAARLAQQAADKGLSPQQQAERLVAAVEELAGSAGA